MLIGAKNGAFAGCVNHVHFIAKVSGPTVDIFHFLFCGRACFTERLHDAVNDFVVFVRIFFSIFRSSDTSLCPADSNFFYVTEIFFAALHTILHQMVDQIHGESKLVLKEKNGFYFGG